MKEWIPPKSPYDLLQERYWPDDWKILVVCLMLNQTSRKQVEPMIESFFDKYPDALSIVQADEEDLVVRLKSLGLVNRRIKTLKKFSSGYLERKWKSAKDLYGCGKYADDAYRIFIKGDWKNVEPNDHALNFYHGFLSNEWNGENNHA